VNGVDGSDEADEPTVDDASGDDAPGDDASDDDAPGDEAPADDVVTAEVVDVAGDAAGPAGGDEPLDLAGPAPAELVALAEALGVATEFWDWQGAHVPVPVTTILGVLEALDVPLRTHADVRGALDAVRERPWRQVLPDVVVTREGQAPQVAVHVPADGPVRVWVAAENDEQWDLPAAASTGRTHTVDGVAIEELTVDLPPDLPLGWHELVAEHGGEETRRPLVVTPQRVPLPAALEQDRAWGFMTQLYSVRSRDSWGLGDLGDLTELVSWSAREHGAGFVLVNPLHAAEPVPPMEPSPYLPTTRRFVNPMYLRIEDIREVAYLPATDRAIVEWQAEAMKALNDDPPSSTGTPVLGVRSAQRWKKTGLRPAAEPESGRPRLSRRSEPARARAWPTSRCGARSLERYGLPTATDRATPSTAGPDAVAHMHFELPSAAPVPHVAAVVPGRAAGLGGPATAQDAGMPIRGGHDLAVGVHPDGADAWALRDVLAGDGPGRAAGPFNQQGRTGRSRRGGRTGWSSWGTGRTGTCCDGAAPRRGALRIDHIVGLFRFWWVPRATARRGHLRPVRPRGADRHPGPGGLAGRGFRGRRGSRHGRGLDPRLTCRARHPRHSILWFEKDGEGRPLPPQTGASSAWRPVTTHDLPPTAGYLAGEHVELRERLGLLTAA
jgi:4-alpha-glucanotransferase